MTDGSGVPDEAANTEVAQKKSSASSVRRDIPGNLPYLTASGTLKKVLDRIIEAQRPDRFSIDFLENVLKLTGGSARATIAILKRCGFLSSDGSPTELYARFKTEGGRSAAALQGLKNGFPEIFKRSEYAYTADDAKLKDIVTEITGLNRSDPVAVAIRGTFNVLRSYIAGPVDVTRDLDEGGATAESSSFRPDVDYASSPQNGRRLGLVNNINIVLPETSDLKVLNAIFRSLKDNLLS